MLQPTPQPDRPDQLADLSNGPVLPAKDMLDALLTSVRSENGLGQHYLDPSHPAVRAVVDVARATGAKEALDFACGRGLTSVALTEEAGLTKVVATDINEPGLVELSARAAERSLPIEASLFDAANAKLPAEWAGAFDLVVAKDLYPFLSPEENRRFLQNAAEALKEGGTLVFTAPSVDSRLYREGIDTHDPFYKRLSPDAKQFVQTSLDFFSFASETKLESLLKDVGLKLSSVSYYGRESGWITAVATK